MKGYSPKEVIEILIKNGWYEKRSKGSHFIFCNNQNKNIVTVSVSKKDIPIETIKNISKQSGIKFK